MAHCRKIVIYALFLIMVTAYQGWAESYVWEKTVTLTGEIQIKRFYGSPNYGENPSDDIIFEIPILLTDKEFSVRGISYGLFSVLEGQRKTQLIWRDSKLDSHDFLEKCVMVTGKLNEAVSGHHYTNSIVIVSHIEFCSAGMR